MTDGADAEAGTIAAVAAGDADALELLYRRYGRLTYSIAFRISGDRAVAEECTQDAFLALWQKAADFDPRRARVSTWLFAVARNRALDRMRRRDPAEALAQRGPGPAAQTSVQELVLAADRAERLAAAMAELPEAQLETLQLAYFDGLSQQEIADRLGLPLGTVKGRTRLALDRLRVLFVDEPVRMEAT